MTFFESTIALLLLAILLLQISRRTWIPYPTMLAAAGVAVALVPGAPAIVLDGHVALALFIAPVLLDAAFDFPLSAIRTLWRPLLSLAVGAVVVTTLVVAWIGWAFAGLPVAAALALGAIVAPPDAAAATTVLRSARLPRRTVEVLTGESLLNDAAALLLFGAAVAIQANGGLDGGVALRLGIAAPGGVVLGIAVAFLNRRVTPFVASSLGGNLLQFVNTYLVWLIAERLGLSPVLAIVAMAMALASFSSVRSGARNRIQSYAVWSIVVFLLNVLAFLLMGMQVRAIVGGMSAARLGEAMGFAGLVIAAVVVTRMAWVLGYGWIARRVPAIHGQLRPPSVRHGIVVGWCGMRGLVTLAAALALPQGFPQRDLILLAAFGVVLATLVVQGLTLSPLIRLLGLQDGDEAEREVTETRRALADTAIAVLDREQVAPSNPIRHMVELDRAAFDGGRAATAVDAHQQLKRAMIAAQRDRLYELRDDGSIGADTFMQCQEQLDWKELAIGAEDGETIEEG